MFGARRSSFAAPAAMQLAARDVCVETPTGVETAIKSFIIYLIMQRKQFKQINSSDCLHTSKHNYHDHENDNYDEDDDYYYKY